MKSKIVINGAQGKMGSEAVIATKESKRFELVGTLGRNDDLKTFLARHSVDIVIDLTSPLAVYENSLTIINANVRPVIGTTGLTNEQINDLSARCEKQSLGGIIAPNFSLMANLMMKMAEKAAQYIPAVEIIEYHNPSKKDKPSGTALKTASLIRESNTSIDDIPTHSVRLPGHVAHQEVIFGGEDESLRIRHDSLNRRSFMPGLLFACKEVLKQNSLIYGLDNLITF